MSSNRAVSRSERIPSDEAAGSVRVVAATLVGHHGGYMLRLDDEDDTLLPRLSERIRVLAEVLLRQAVDVCISAFMRDLDDSSAHRGVCVRILRIGHGDGNARLAADV